MIQKPANKCIRGISNSTKKTYYKKVIVRIRMYVLLSVRHGEIDRLPRGTASFDWSCRYAIRELASRISARTYSLLRRCLMYHSKESIAMVEEDELAVILKRVDIISWHEVFNIGNWPGCNVLFGDGGLVHGIERIAGGLSDGQVVCLLWRRAL